MNLRRVARRLRRPTLFILTLLTIEFLDEFVYGAHEAAWPLIRSEMQLSYEQIGLLLSVPMIIGYVIEPALGILGDVWKRRVLILGGGVLFTLALLLTALSYHPIALLFAFILFSPASGAFVGLSQSALMDSDTERHEHNMARWEFAGSVGVLVGSLAMGLIAALGGSWRTVFALSAMFALIAVLIARQFQFKSQPTIGDEQETAASAGFIGGIRDAIQAVRRPEVLRWLVLLEFSNLMLDVLYSYLALYFVDVAGVQESQAGLAVAVWTGVGLIGDFLLIPLLEHVRGLAYLRISALLELVLFPAFLLMPGLVPKLIILALLGFFNAGWYSILKGQLYSSMPGQSGSVMAVSSTSGLIGSLIPLVIGLAADRWGLQTAIWLLILGPVMLLIGLPRHRLAIGSLADKAAD